MVGFVQLVVVVVVAFVQEVVVVVGWLEFVVGVAESVLLVPVVCLRTSAAVTLFSPGVVCSLHR